MPDAPATTLSSAAYARLRHDILQGALPPGQKLRIEEACARTGTTSTPVREALNQLAMEGFVERREQRGFVVAEISAAELTELTDTRCWVEPIALREAIAHRTQTWEEALVLAFHRLARTDRSIEVTTFRENPDWEQTHGAFHQALIATCPSRFLIDFCRRLSDHAVRYRRLAMSTAYRRRDVTAEHRGLMEAAIDGRANDAAERLIAHYRRTASFVQTSETELQKEPEQ
jgi:GntR family transcriptional regulator, carbon starvation induced regulator